MYKKKETGSSVSEILKYTSNIPHDFESHNSFEQKKYDFGTRGSSFDGSRDAYLTYTDNSPSNRGGKRADFKQYSFNLYKETMELYINDPETLQYYHRRGWQKIKSINEDYIVLYHPSNPLGNSNAGWRLARIMSDSDKARLSSRQNAFEKALANIDKWAYFATFTLDKTKQDRYDFHKALAHVTKFLRRRGIKYFMVPERHKDGAWHFHALLSSEAREYLVDFEGKALNNWYIRDCLSKGIPIKNFKAYSDSFGFNTIEPCRDKERCVHYMTKYVLKTFDDENFERVSRRRYFCSTGLKSPSVILPSEVKLEDFEVDYLSEYTEKVTLRRYDVPQFALEPIQNELSGSSIP